MTIPVFAHASRPRWLSRGVRMGVLLVILVGTLLSSLGALRTHALAMLDAVQHTQAAHDGTHGHSHDDEPLAAYEGASHTHLGSDHSHDKAHDLPAMRVVAVPTIPAWKPRSHNWIDRLVTHRLERPPKTA